MAAYRRVYDSYHLQADCQEPGSAPEPYARQSSMDCLYLYTCSLTVVSKRIRYVMLCYRRNSQDKTANETYVHVAEDSFTGLYRAETETERPALAT